MTLSGEDLGDVLATHLMSDGLYVTDCERHDGAVHIGYESPGVGETIPQTQVGSLLRLLLDLAGIETEGRDVSGIPEVGEWEPENVEVWAFEDADADDREATGHFEVHEGWFHALEAGYLSETDFSTLVLSTLE
ncbi:hypothetical protein [Halosegnis sp.]|uniref:hypothetical protein n=1 Tax=Halosegnis sp. TaxID=2864959 RepID=UPI0035D3EE89